MKTNMAFLLFAEFIHTYKTERMQPLHPLKTTQPSWRNQPCQVTTAIEMRTHFKNMMVKIKIFSQFLWNLCDVVKVQKVFENCVFLLLIMLYLFLFNKFLQIPVKITPALLIWNVGLRVTLTLPVFPNLTKIMKCHSISPSPQSRPIKSPIVLPKSRVTKNPPLEFPRHPTQPQTIHHRVPMHLCQSRR